MKFLIVIFFTLSSIIPFEVSQAASLSPELVKENVGEIKLINPKLIQKEFKFNKRIVREQERSDSEKLVYVDSLYKPILNTTDFDLNEDSLGFVGFPEDIVDLGNSEHEFGLRCDFIKNKGIKQFTSTFSTGGIPADQFFQALGYSSQNDFFNKCGVNGQNCVCDPGLECQETDTLNSIIGNVEFQDRAGKTCLFRRTCNDGDKSPFEICVEVESQACMSLRGSDPESERECAQIATTSCRFEETKCFYTDKCLGIIPSKQDLENGIQGEGVMACEDNYNCSSGYCKEFVGAAALAITGEDVGAIKLCAKPAECRPACTPLGEELNDPSVNFCCAGSMAYDDGTKTSCIDPAELISIGPPMFKVEVDPTNCTGGIYEDSYLDEDGNAISGSEAIGLNNSMSDENSNEEVNFSEGYYSWSKDNKIAYTDAKARRISRIIRSFEFLWANSKSNGLNDTFGINKNIVALGKKMKEANETSIRETSIINYRLQDAQKKLEEKMISDNEVASSEGAAGISILKTLAGYNYDMGNVFSVQSSRWYDLLGMKYDPLTYEAGTGDSVYTKSLESSYSMVQGGINHDAMPLYFEENSISGLRYTTRHPSLLKKTGFYSDYDKKSSIGIFETVELPCNNINGDPIEGKETDWFGDKKNNSVCVKEMAKVTNVKDGSWLELINPIYPDGLLGTSTDNSFYTENAKNFPNVHRPVIDNSVLKINIASEIDKYSEEQLSITTCHSIDRFTDELSDNELKMLVKLKIDENIESEDLEELKNEAAELYGPNWRSVIASNILKDYTYNSLIGTHQNKYVRDGFTLGSSFFSFLGGIAVTAITFGMVNTLNPGDGNQYSFTQGITNLIYEFALQLIDNDDASFGVWSGGCFTESCEREKYLNSVSFDWFNEELSYQHLLDSVFYLESFSKAKELYHKEVALCLNNLAKNYSEAYGATDFDSSLIVRDQQNVEFNSTCSSGGGSSTSPGFNIDSQDINLTPQDVVAIKDSNLGKGNTIDSVTVANGSLDKSDIGISSFKPNTSQADPGKLESEISKLREGLDKRNQTANSINRKKSAMLDRLSGGRFSGSVKKAKEVESLFNSESLNPLVGKLKSKLQKRGVASAVSTKVLEVTKPDVKNELLKKVSKDLKSSDIKLNQDTENPNKILSSSFKTYGGEKGPTQDQINLARNVKHLKNRLKQKDAPELWDIISKTYIIHGVPRLFDFNTK